MAESLLSQLMGMLGNAGGAVADEASLLARGAYEEASNPNNESDPNRLLNLIMAPGTLPLRAVDRASEAMTGSPLLLSREQSLLSGVSPGVSQGEQEKAATKLMQLQAKQAARVEDAKVREREAFAKFNQSALKKKSGKDTLAFAAIGDAVARDEEAPTGGNFSRTKGQSEESRALDQITKQGIPEQLARVLLKLGKATTQQGADAAKLEASLLPGAQSKNKQQAQALFETALKSNNISAIPILRAALINSGLSEEEVDKLLGMK